MINRKRTRGRNIQSIKYYRYEMRNGKRVRIEVVGEPKQIHHPAGFPDTDTKLSDVRSRNTTSFNMDISYIGGGELEGIVKSESVNVVVHAGNRATLIRKAQRILTEKYGFMCPIINIPKPSERIEGVVI